MQVVCTIMHLNKNLMVAGKMKVIPPASPSSPQLHGISFWSAIPAVWVSPHNCLCSSSLLSGQRGEKQAIMRTSLCYPLCFQHKSKSQPHSSYCREEELRAKPAWCTATQRCPNTHISNRGSIQVLHNLGTNWKQPRRSDATIIIIKLIVQMH